MMIGCEIENWLRGFRDMNQCVHQARKRAIFGVRHRFGWAAIVTGIILTSCTPTQTVVTPPTDAPTPTVSPSPTASPSPNVSPTIGAPVPTLPSPTTSPIATASPSPGKPENVVKIEAQITDLVTKTANLNVQSVNCPVAIDEQSTNKTYDCQVQSDAGAFTVVIQPTGQTGKFRWGTRGLLLLSKLDAFIQQSVASRGGGKVTVDCGTKARIAKQGETFDCKVTDAKGGVKTARVTVRDDLGNVYLSGL